MSSLIGQKGLSPLIAVVLLIAFTITVATFVAAFSQSFTRESIEESAQRGEQLSAACQFANIQLTAATYDDAGDRVSVLARNIGTEDLRDFRIIVFTSEVDFTEYIPSNTNVTMRSGDIATFSVTGVTRTPTSVQIKSNLCPVEATYRCTFTRGSFLC